MGMVVVTFDTTDALSLDTIVRPYSGLLVSAGSPTDAQTVRPYRATWHDRASLHFVIRLVLHFVFRLV